MTRRFKKPPTPPDARRIGYTIPAAVELSGLGRSAIYEALRAGHVRAAKAGRHTIILADSLEAYVLSLPAAVFKAVA